MAITVVSHALNRVVDEIFADLKESYFFNYLYDLVVYSTLNEANVTHVREVQSGLQDQVSP